MNDLLAPRGVPLPDQMACVRRELEFRKRVYPRSVARGAMTKFQADKELAAMSAVLKTLESLERRP